MLSRSILSAILVMSLGGFAWAGPNQGPRSGPSSNQRSNQASDPEAYYSGDADFLDRLSTSGPRGDVKIIKAKRLVGKGKSREVKSLRAKTKAGREVASNVTVTTKVIQAARTVPIVVQPVAIPSYGTAGIRSAVTTSGSTAALSINFGYKSGNFRVHGHLSTPGYYFNRSNYSNYSSYGYGYTTYYSPGYYYGSYYGSNYGLSYYSPNRYCGYRTGFGFGYGGNRAFGYTNFRVSNVYRPTARTIAHINHR